MEEFRRCFQSENVRKNVFDNLDKQTICHGDCHGWNHMFLKDEQKAGNNNLPSVIAVDFGMVGTGRVSWDINYFFGMSIDPNNFHEEKILLQAYYESLVKEIKKSQNESNFNYTFEEFEREYYLVWSSYMVKTIYNMNLILNPTKIQKSAKEKAKAKKKDSSEDEKSETLVFAFYKLIERNFLRCKTYYMNGVFKQFLV